ncbi:MAG TPA: DNA polymerase III subunit delta [Verrucomicrobiales bacterium]|nr:DNA polymerase III subunit delta [Verrucomicrobiales bacterium]|tara:strand:- start:250 stop:1377 length:1128 start_codon:yes stop_codon:yes gene_type:complete
MSKATLPEGPLALIHGDDDFAVSRRARQINQGWCEAMGGEDHEIVEAAAANAGEAVRALGRLREALETLPFFGTGKVVWFKDCNFLGDDRTAKAADVSTGLADLAALLKTFEWNGVQLLISAGKCDKRKTFYKTVSKAGHAEAFEALSVDDSDWQGKAKQVVNARFKALKKQTDYGTVSELVQMVGPDSAALINECNKVATYVGDDPKVTTAAVRAIVIEGKHAKAFALGDALGDRNLQTVLQRLDEELWAAKTDKKRSVIGLVAGLVSKTRAMLMARSLLDAGLLKPARAFQQFKPQIDLLPVDLFPGDRRISPLGLHPYVLFNATRQAANYTRTELVRALEALMHCNRRLVSSSLDDTLVLQKTLISIVAKPA